ncbi:MAG: GxxExxY protein [Ignavibacteria bacterium]|nr:GxxExxY protein [Ignavibacteria bacterium]
MNENEIGKIVVDSALEVHRALGPGLLESTYETCLRHELTLRNLNIIQQKELPVIYKGLRMDKAYRLDLVIENKVIIEIKAVEELNNIHLAQMLSYLKLSGQKLGYLINFNVKLIKDGIKRVVNNLDIQNA